MRQEPDLHAIAEDFLSRLPSGRPVIIALSGGSDSTGLLHAFTRAARHRTGHRIVAATVDHGLRAESAGEARAVGEACARLGVRHHILVWRGEKPATGLQEAARMARYRLLSDLAAQLGASAVLLGHTANDQAETIAMRKARSPEDAMGLSGMAPAMLFQGRTWFLRPFLGLDRPEIRRYLTALGEGWVDDPSNLNPVFERARLRAGMPEAAGRDMGKDVMDGRARLSADAAAFLDRALSYPFGHVAKIDPGCFEPGNPAHLHGLSAVIAMAGGRSHRPGAESLRRIAAFLSSAKAGRISAGRTTIDLRRQGIFIYRENRGLATETVEPGERRRWDGRFEICNHGSRTVTLGPGPGGTPMAWPDDAAERLAGIPGGVQARAMPAWPHLLSGGDAGPVTIERLASPYADFLPSFDACLAAVLAGKAGMRHFMPLPLRPVAVLTSP